MEKTFGGTLIGGTLISKLIGGTLISKLIGGTQLTLEELTSPKSLEEFNSLYFR